MAEPVINDYVNSLLKFIPPTILRHLVEYPDSTKKLPECQGFSTVVLVAEIQNFYHSPNKELEVFVDE